MLRNIVLSLLFILALIFTASCSGGDDYVITPLPEQEPVAQGTGNTACLGFWQVTIDKEAGTIQAVDMRTSDLILNVLGFLEPPALTGMTIDFTTLVLDPANKKIEVDVIVTHPLPDTTFMGFDVRGIVFGAEVKNADGYTIVLSPEWFTGVPFGYQNGLLGVPDSVAHYKGMAGYKYFCDGLGKDDDLVTFMSDPANIANRGVFSPKPQKNTRHYVLDWNNVTYDYMVFNYAIYANYDWPKGTPPFDVGDFPITTANSQEAICVKVTEVSNYLAMMGSVGSGTISLDVEVFDWQGNVNQVTIESITPGILGPKNYDTYVGPGSTAHSYLYKFVSVPAIPTAAGDLPLLITVTDSKTFGQSWLMTMLPTLNYQYYKKVYNCFRYVTKVIQCPVPQPTGSYAGWGVVTNKVITCNNLVNFPGLSTRLYKGTSQWVGTNVVYLSPTTFRADFDLKTAPCNEKLDLEVKNGCGEKGTLAACWDTAVTLKVVGTPNISVGSGMLDIAVDPSQDRSLINYGTLNYFRIYSSNYTAAIQYTSPWSTTHYFFDATQNRIFTSTPYPAGTVSPPYYNMWANGAWTFGFGGNYYSGNHIGDRDIANVPGQVDQGWMIYAYGATTPTSYYFFLFSGATNPGSPTYTAGSPFFGGSGTTGVIWDNIRGADMDLGTSPYRMYILEALPATSTGVVEKYRLASPPVYDSVQFGEGSFFKPLDITVDSNGWVYVLDLTATGATKMWVYTATGTLVTSKEFSISEVSGTGLRIDAAVFPEPDEVHILHTGGVTKVTISY